LKPALAIVFFSGFGGFFVFGGFQSATVELHRGTAGAVNGKLTRAHFFGVYTVSAELRAIRQATMETGEARPRFGLVARVSAVALVSESGSTSIFAGLSNVDETYKRQIMRAVNQYIRGGDNRAFHETFTISNVFGWFGLPFLLVGVYAAVTWPVTIVWCWRRHIVSGADAPAGGNAVHGA
jgi:hypothetical protein